MASLAASDLLRTDHRQIEIALDRLLATVKHPCEGMVLQVGKIFAEIQRLMEPHVRKEENVFYPYLRAAFSELLAEMDEQHEYIAEVTDGVDELTVAFSSDIETRTNPTCAGRSGDQRRRQQGSTTRPGASMTAFITIRSLKR